MKDEIRKTRGQLTLRSIRLAIGLMVSSFILHPSSLVFLPSSAVASVDGWSAVESEVYAAIGRGEVPGAVVVILHKDEVVYRKAFGSRAKLPVAEPMTVDTIFDLASITKPVATATSVWSLIEAGKLKLDEKVVAYWPEFAPNGKDKLTLAHLLLHTSGLIADNPVADYKDGPAKALERICELKTLSLPGEKFVYSDVNFIVLGELVRRVSGRPLDVYAKETIFDPLGMRDTGFRPAPDMKARIAPTEQRDGQWIRGEVHDPRAHLLGGVAGHAGLFGSADDLVTFARMLLAGGTLNGKQVLHPETVVAMTTPQPVPNGQRTYGWDARTGFSANRGEHFGGFGHTGFTGTSIWIDPANHAAVIVLANSVHPDGKGKAKTLRNRVATLAAERLRIAKETPKVQPEIPNTQSLQQAAPKAHPLQRVGFEGVATGIDVLKREGFARLHGKRVGLVTNQTGRDRNGIATVDLLHKADGVTLVALFGPEHGIRGALDDKVNDSKDEATGLPVYSLYGPRRKPTPDLLKGIDVLVYDIQDIGCRFYTYISTLGNVMEACAENKIKLIVLDRPNPIGGLAIEGPLADAGRFSFVAYHNIPIRHGMTVGELARMFQAERQWPLELDVVKCEGWNRADYFDQTLLPWVNPSPNMRSLTQAILYPGIGLLETTNISVGRGTDTPFEWFGAPWLDGRAVVAELNKHNLPGLTFVPTSRTPTGSVHANKPCGGVQIFVTNRNAVEPIRLGLTIIDTLRSLFPNEWDPKKIDTLLVHKSTYDRILAKQPVAPLAQEWSLQVSAFHQRRRPFLLYEAGQVDGKLGKQTPSPDRPRENTIMAKQHALGFLKVVNEAKSQVKECTVDDVKARMDRGEKVILIDVREESEFAADHLPGAVHLSKGIIERDVETRFPDPATELVLYCGGGFRSALAGANLKKMGYTNIISMDGGHRGWKERGYPMEK